MIEERAWSLYHLKNKLDVKGFHDFLSKSDF